MNGFEYESSRSSADAPGWRLRLAREQRHLTTQDAADALHLERSMVEALEEDAYDSLPPMIFTKGYLRSYARFLGLDESEIIASFERIGVREADRPLTPSVGRASRTPSPGGGSGLPWLILLLVVVLVAVGGFLWVRHGGQPAWAEFINPFNRPGGDESPAITQPATRPESGPPSTPPNDETGRPAPDESNDRMAAAGGSTSAPSETTKAEGSDTGPAAGTGTAGRGEPEPESQPEPEENGTAGDVPPDTEFGGPLNEAAPRPGVEEPEAVARSEDETAAVDEGATGEPVPDPSTLESLTFVFSGESWIEVTDSRGRRLLFGLLGSSGSRSVRGVPPFDIVVGDVNRVTITYEGDVVNLDEYTRGSVARMTLGDS